MKKIIILFSIFSILFINFAPTFAAIPNKAEGLTVSPPLTELSLEPGKIYHQQIKLNNPTEQIVQVYPVARNFSASGETGAPTIESPNEDATYGLASWISFNQPKIVLTSDQEATFDYEIKVPLNAEPGGHYASVLFASEPPKLEEKSTQVALASMVGSLILGKVPGEIVEKGEIREFATSKLIYIKPNANFILRIANSGNIHFKPMGEIAVYNWGRKVTDIDINPVKGNVLPNSVRRFENLNYQGHWWSFGLYKAKLIAAYGEKNNPLTDVLIFWIIPWWLIVIIALIILLIIFFIWRRKRKNRKTKSKFTPQPPPLNKKRIILQ